MVTLAEVALRIGQPILYDTGYTWVVAKVLRIQGKEVLIAYARPGSMNRALATEHDLHLDNISNRDMLFTKYKNHGITY